MEGIVMIYGLGILATIFATFLATQFFYNKKIANLVRIFEIAVEAEFDSAYKAGWQDGKKQGEHNGRMEALIDATQN